jgi:serine/threonine protein phosphatase 1
MEPLQKFKKNSYGNDYVVGDIHGMYDLLFEKLNKVNFVFDTDRLFSVGDLIDRGPDSQKCMDLCYEPWFFAVRGNHEQMMFDAVVHKFADGGMWIGNGGMWYIDECCDDLDVVIQDLSERLPLGIQVETDNGLVGIVHADVYVNEWEKNFQDIDYNQAQYILWSRSRIEGHSHLTEVIGLDRLYVGHSVRKEKVIIDNVHHIDAGSCFYKNIHIEKIS